MAAAAIAFVIVQLAARPFFGGGPDGEHRVQKTMWAINAGALLLLLATGGGLLKNRGIRALVNDDVSRSHYKTAVVVGYWVAMATAMGLYLVPGVGGFTAREAVYMIVTPSIAVALLAFSYLEHRAHRDA
jgi:hypothetical protein